MVPFRDLFIWSTMYLSDDKEKFLEPLPLEKDLLFSLVGGVGQREGERQCKRKIFKAIVKALWSIGLAYLRE